MDIWMSYIYRYRYTIYIYMYIYIHVDIIHIYIHCITCYYMLIVYGLVFTINSEF
jgi:hypothetical protein